MKMIANIAVMTREACSKGSLLTIAGEYIAPTTTPYKKLVPMTSIQNNLLSVEDDIKCLPEADHDEKKRMPIKL
jgi:hypothetical protein